MESSGNFRATDERGSSLALGYTKNGEPGSEESSVEGKFGGTPDPLVPSALCGLVHFDLIAGRQLHYRPGWHGWRLQVAP